MPFSTKTQHAPATNVDVKEEHRQITEAINVRRAEYAKLDDRSEELARVEKALAFAKGALANAEKQAKQVTNEITVLTTTRDGIRLEAEKARRTLAELENDKASSAKLVDVLQADFSSKKTMLDEVERSKQSAEKAHSEAVKTLSTINQSIENARQTLALVEKDVAAKREEHKKDHDLHQGRIKAGLTEYEDLQRGLATVQAAIKEAKAELGRTQEQNAKILDTAETEARRIVAEAEEKAAKTTGALIEREGMISKREKWQAEHQEKLLKFKEELEKLTNRKLPITIEI